MNAYFLGSQMLTLRPFRVTTLLFFSASPVVWTSSPIKASRLEAVFEPVQPLERMRPVKCTLELNSFLPLDLRTAISPILYGMTKGCWQAVWSFTVKVIVSSGFLSITPYSEPFHTDLLVSLAFSINELLFLKVMPVSSDLPNGHLRAEKGRGKNYLISSCFVPFYSSAIKL